MKILKIFALIVGGAVVLLLGVAAVTKKDYSVTRDATINLPKDKVFAYLVQLKNQDNFSVWASMDKDMKKTYRGTDGTVGFVSAWDSAKDDVGAGEQEIKKILPGERIDFELRFLRPFESKSDAFLKTEAVDPNKTKVTWGFSAKMPYPMNLMLLFVDFEGMIGKDFETGLLNLKLLLERT